jgi:hypothetical protein
VRWAGSGAATNTAPTHCTWPHAACTRRGSNCPLALRQPTS